MSLPVGLLALWLSAQVPPPDAGARVSRSLRGEEKLLFDREAEALTRLADRLAAAGQADAASRVRQALPPRPSADGSSPFRPLPEVVGRRGDGLANVATGRAGPAGGRAEFDAIRGETAGKLFELARRAATSQPRHYALADACLRAVLDRNPDHPEARRLLGYVPHEGGWASPFAVRQLRQGKVLHPAYGWVAGSWLPNLERGELPAPAVRGAKRERWLPAAEADDLRRDWRNGWEITTEHFFIKTDVPFAEAITFGRHLEAFHDLFFSILADVVGEKLPLARRFQDRALVESAAPRHQVHYYATRNEYVEHVRPLRGEKAAESLGLYVPPKPGRGRRAPAYFFRDPGGELDVTATLYHEVSHQLLFETGSAGLEDYLKNVGNFWVFEGMGTYFESLTTRPDGSLRVGGRVGRRMDAARENLGRKGQTVPLAEFVRLDENRFNDDTNVYLHYQQADALATFLMDGKGGAYREGFLDYFRDAYHGRVRRVSGKSLTERVDAPYDQLESELIDYLKAG